MSFPKCDVVIIGMVDKLCEITNNEPWYGNGEFSWSIKKIGNSKVALLGCKFSFWGDIAHILLLILKFMKVKDVIYIGKVGGIISYSVPNTALATGFSSRLKGRDISWDSIIKLSSDQRKNIFCGKHVTLPSVIQETTDWLYTAKKNKFYFVDPEIGWMAYAAKLYGMGFGYLHIISDNLSRPHQENLSNERDFNTLIKRRLLFSSICEIVKINISTRYCIQRLPIFSNLYLNKSGYLVDSETKNGLPECVSSMCLARDRFTVGEIVLQNGATIKPRPSSSPASSAPTAAYVLALK
jgi:hypothetical protein